MITETSVFRCLNCEEVVHKEQIEAIIDDKGFYKAVKFYPKQSVYCKHCGKHTIIPICDKYITEDGSCQKRS